MLKKVKDAEAELDFTNTEKIEDKKTLLQDYIQKFSTEDVGPLDDYIRTIGRKNNKLLAFAAEHHTVLNNLDKMIQSTVEKDWTLDPMIDSLKMYCSDHP